MSESALYRKYRPAKFSEVLDQEHVVLALKGALKEEKTTHAYLFAGPRGTGKTTVARILARELGASPNDIYEIDAASNRGVDEIRELREAVRTLPFESVVKVYIIDEVHMLTTPAFNALLKTLEEPPKHVVFILATTELHKLPDTIVSRCQTYTFKRPGLETLAKVVKSVAKSEGALVDTDAARLIALLGEGSFRDTLGVLQKVIGVGEGELTRARVELLTGAPKLELVWACLSGLLARDTNQAMMAVETALDEATDVPVFLKLLLRDVRLAMLLKFAPELKDSIVSDLPAEESKFLLEIAAAPTAAALPTILKELLDAYQASRHYYLPQVALELAVIKLTGEN